MKKRDDLINLEEKFINIEKLLKSIRKEIAQAAEGVRIAARDSRAGRLEVPRRRRRKR